MKNITIKSLVMGVLLFGSCSQIMVASEQKTEEFGRREKATWGQLAKHAGLALGKVALTAYLLDALYNCLDCARKEDQALKKFVKHVKNLDSISYRKMEEFADKNDYDKQIKKVEHYWQDREGFSYFTSIWKDRLEFMSLLAGGFLTLTGLKDLYNAFKIAKAMLNKETSVKLV